MIEKISKIPGWIIFAAMFMLGRVAKSAEVANPFKGITIFTLSVMAICFLMYAVFCWNEVKSLTTAIVDKLAPIIFLLFATLGFASVCFAVVLNGTDDISLAIVAGMLCSLLSLLSMLRNIITQVKEAKSLIDKSPIAGITFATGMIKKIMFFAMLVFGIILYISPTIAYLALFVLFAFCIIKKIVDNINEPKAA